MKKQRNVHKARIEAAMEIISRILREKITERKRVVKLVEEVYRSKALQPIRGKAWPHDIWDKEVATVYVVAKYALNIHEEEPSIFHKVFSVEEALEEVADTILDTSRPREEKVRMVKFLLGGSLDSNTFARVFRVVATAVLLGFRSENDIEKLLKLTAQLFPEQSETARKYARYYIALRTAEAIARGVIRDRIAKEAFKQALAARIGLEKIIPDDEYIGYIAKTLFSLPEKKLRNVLSLSGGRAKQPQESRA